MRTPARFLPISLLSILIVACTGQIQVLYDVPDEEDVDTYNTEHRETGDPADAEQASLDLNLDIEPAIAVYPACGNNGELELAAWLQNLPFGWPFDTEREGAPPYPMAFSLEAADGQLLGSVPLRVDEMVAAVPTIPVGTIRAFTHPMHITIPAALVQAGQFQATLFACKDDDADGACSDEALGEMGDLTTPAEIGWTNVISQVPVDVTIADGVITFATAPLARWGEDAMEYWDNLFNFTADEMEDVFGVDLPELTLVFVSHHPDCPPPQGRTDGCFVEGTRLQLGNRSVRVEQLGRGTAVALANGKLALVKRAVAGPEAEPVVSIRTVAGHALTVTSEHPIATAKGELALARNLSPGDQILSDSGAPVVIESIERLPYAGTVFNFELPGDSVADHLVVAEGLVVGDLYLQEKLGSGTK